jgi:transposase-like protein
LSDYATIPVHAKPSITYIWITTYPNAQELITLLPADGNKLPVTLYKAKNLFPDDQAAIKAVYLSIMNIQKKWTMPIREWGRIVNQFSIIFENRCNL